MRCAAAASLEPRHAVAGSPSLGIDTGDPSAPVRIEQRSLTLEVRSAGRLVPWIGPAVRGITALRHRAAVCRQPLEEWAGRWKNCHGCPHLPSCAYGIAFEQDGADGGDAVRRVVIAPEFPVDVHARRGTTIEMRITSIGADVSDPVLGIVAALAAAGRGDGLGPDRVRFTIAEHPPTPAVLVVDPARLPPPAQWPLLPRLTIHLESPLFLRERDARRSRRMILEPDFRTFVRHAMRIVHECFPSLGGRPAEAHEALASAVATSESNLRPFRQEKASRRTFRRFELEGVVGDCTFENVPGYLLPWLTLAGILHVGGHRVAGAGGWTVSTAAAAKATSHPDHPR